jgi:hypothetical protein
MTNKDINRKIAELAGDAEVYYLQESSFVDNYNGFLPESKAYFKKVLVKTLEFNDYSTDVSLALDAAKRIADKNNYTFVLTYLVDDHWKASFGNYIDCAEHCGIDPAHCTCVAVLKFMGRL